MKITIQDKQSLLDFINSDADALTLDIDFNFLMEVVEKIESLEDTERFEISNSAVNITHYQSREVRFIYNGYHTNNGIYLMGGEKTVNTKIEAVYNACVGFINWYNLNK